MYKIMLVKRASSTEPLYTPYKVEVETDGEIVREDFQTDDVGVLESKITELLEVIPINQIKPVEDLEFIVNAMVGENPITIV